MASYGGLEGIRTGLTTSADHPSFGQPEISTVAHAVTTVDHLQVVPRQ